MLRVLSLGGGVQSSTLALLAARGEIGPMPDCAIFADTMSEPAGVYGWLSWLEAQLPFPVYRVSKGSLRENLLETGPRRFVSVPFFTDANGKSEGMTRRQCTREFKIAPIEQKIRSLLGLGYRQRAPLTPVVEQWIGISWDERQRMKDSHTRFISHRWPLIERQWTRGHCLEWFAAQGYELPPKSACTFCPFHDDAMWADMKENDPESFADAVAVDAAIRSHGSSKGKRMTAKLYAHRSCKPLDQVEFNVNDRNGHLFGMLNECEGMCGV